ncbi:HdeD family acid-resistance protein [Halothiobacillus sp.]|uniref:HdeD family acid-resistance protein n=1 Tax=Halothiobacillus sp. TaxID=1891311 RepID=UPI002AD4059E|nr:DUF308 domain-containing protein [Halothiobacillus sp.]
MMNVLPIDKKILDKFGPYTLVTGVLLIVLGTAGILLPVVMSLSTAIFVGWLLLVGGGLWAIHTYQHSPTHVVNWIKPVLLFLVGGLMLFYPVSGVAAVGLLLAIYLLLDAMHSFTFAQSIFPAKGWGWMTFNGVVSALLAVLFLIGWPATSLWLVGLYVGISLLFDGWALVMIGWALRKGAQP